MNVTTPQPDKNAPSNKPWLLCLVLLFASFSSNAQVVNDGATKTLANVTNTITANVTLGTNGSFTLLALSDNALLTKSNRQPRNRAKTRIQTEEIVRK